MKKLLFLLLIISFGFATAQQNEKVNDTTEIKETILDTITDNRYREDQFYIGFTFNLLLDRPTDIKQSGFSGGFHIGFMRDMPINEQRKMAIAAGLGWSANSYGQNLVVDSRGSETEFYPIDGGYDTNRLTIYQIEAPIQFRWRNSTPTLYKFWRVYTGLKLGYIHHSKAKFVGDDFELREVNLPEINKIRYGITLSFGYNTYNFHLYYSLNDLIDGKMLNSNENVGLSELKIGFMFYIL